jgi:hypothetical protein
VDQNVNCLGQEGTSLSSTPTTAISNGAAPVDNVKSPDGPDSSKQKQELTSGDEQTPDSSKQKQELTSGNEQTPDSSKQKPELTSDKQVKSSEQLISCDKEVREPVTVETEKLTDVNSKKDHKLGSSIGSEMSEQSKVVKDNESLVASELSPETSDGDKKQLSETGNITAEESSKPTDTKPAVVKPKRGQPPAAKSQEKKPVGKKHASSDLKSAKLDPVTDSGGRATRQLNKDAAKSSSTKAAEGESGKKQHKTSMKLQKEDAVSDKDTDEDISLKVAFLFSID